MPWKRCFRSLCNVPLLFLPLRPSLALVGQVLPRLRLQPSPSQLPEYPRPTPLRPGHPPPIPRLLLQRRPRPRLRQLRLSIRRKSRDRPLRYQRQARLRLRRTLLAKQTILTNPFHQHPPCPALRSSPSNPNNQRQKSLTAQPPPALATTVAIPFLIHRPFLPAMQRL
jgi:hypothetical protein